MTLEKTVAVVLAGGVKKFSFREFWHQLEDLFSYREWYFRRGYKSLRRLKLKRNAPGKPRPMVEYILHTLRNTECIDQILLVGPEKEIREKVDPVLLSADSHIEIIPQKESYGHNVKAGYERAGEEHVLFITSDSPTTKEEDICEFIEICGKLRHEYDLIFPVVKESLLRKYHKLFPRPFFRMIPDTIFPAEYIHEKEVQEDGRVGFRITSMAFANLDGFPVERLDEAYDLRKFYRKSSRDRLKAIFGKDLIRRYRKGLKMSDIEKMFFNYEGLKLKIVGLSGPGSALDIDSTRDEKKFHDLQL
jgi:CTP:molybdopterin cytidylyltransferase MocA